MNGMNGLEYAVSIFRGLLMLTVFGIGFAWLASLGRRALHDTVRQWHHHREVTQIRRLARNRRAGI